MTLNVNGQPPASNGGAAWPPDAVSLDPVTESDWTLTSPAGGGTVAVVSEQLVLTQPSTATVLAESGRARAMRALSPDASGDGFEVVGRLCSLSGGSSNSMLTLLVSDSAGSGGREVRAYIAYLGAMQGGYLTQAGGWHGQSASGSIATDGTGWFRLRVRARDAEWATGVSDTGAPPSTWTPRLRFAWDGEINGSWGTTSPPRDFAYWGFSYMQFGSAPGTTAEAVIDHISIRRLSA
jgi:hypothetical protein